MVKSRLQDSAASVVKEDGVLFKGMPGEDIELALDITEEKPGSADLAHVLDQEFGFLDGYKSIRSGSTDLSLTQPRASTSRGGV